MSVPEVPLKWQEFVWSLERLRHKPYSKKVKEKDWFRINPLEMLLVGCQTLQTGSKASRDHGTMILSMDDLSHHMLCTPRYWLRVASVLRSTVTGKDTPGLIIQRCCAALIQLWTGLKRHCELWPYVFVYCVDAENYGEFINHVLTEFNKHLSPDTYQDLREISLEIQSYCSDATLYATQLTSSHAHFTATTPPVTILDLLDGIISSHHDRLLNSLKLSKLALFRTVVSRMELKLPSNLMSDSINEIAMILVEYPEFEANLINIFNILILVGVRGQATTEEGDTNPHRVNEAKDEVAIDIEEDEKDSVETAAGPDHNIKPTIASMCRKLFTQVSSFIVKWSDLLRSDSGVVTKLLEMIYVSLASCSLSQSLPSTVQFLSDSIQTLMVYSTEGYLSDNPTAFFLQLLEFISSLAEQGTEPRNAIQQNLPNLFGPFFGVRHHSVSVQLLEYGYLSMCSQHKKALLTEGIDKLVSLWHLFPAIDRKMAEIKALNNHCTSLSICEGIVDDLMSSLPLSSALDPASGSGNILPTGSENIQHTGSDDSQPMRLDNAQRLQPTGSDNIHPTGSDDKPDILEDSQWSDISQEDRNRDKNSRILVLLDLLKLACAMIRNGDNIVYLYASPLPRLFSPNPPAMDQQLTYNKEKLKKFFGEEPPQPMSCITWQVDKKPLALQLLSLCCASLDGDMATPFQLCAIILPKLVRNLDTMSFPDQEKMKLAIDILRITQETLESGHDIEELISHGLELLSVLLPSTSTPDELREFIQKMIEQVVSSGQTSLLFLIRNACVYMKQTFPDELTDIQNLFRLAVFKGKRNEIRGLFKVCRNPLAEDLYSSLRKHLYQFGHAKITGRQLLALTEFIIAVMDLRKSSTRQRSLADQTLDDDEDSEALLREKEEKEQKENSVVIRLVRPLMDAADQALQENRFKKEVWDSLLSQVSRISLFRTLFSEELVSFSECSVDELQDKFHSKFPPEVLSDSDMMEQLSLCATRIEHMQTPRYQSLKKVLSEILNHFLSLSDTGKDGVDSLMRRKSLLLEHILFSFPRNVADRDKFIGTCGYSERFMDGEFSLVVETDGSHSLEENMRQTLLTCYSEFGDILKQLGITHVSVDGEMIKSVDLFDEMLTLTELKGRRATAVRAIDQRIGATKDGYFHEKKLALLSKEDDIESDFEKQAKAPIKPKTFTVKLNMNFFDCMRCCGSHIVGCYAPTGEHCERPLEIGMRSDSGFLSIYDENHKEIENVEIIMCEEGLLIYKAYTNGHPYDTSQVWVKTFTAMLQGPTPLVPAIIVPKTFPNQKTWDLLLRSSVETELTGSMITCDFDFSPEWRTYYDNRPEKVRCGVDIVLHPGFTMSGSSHQPLFMRQISRVSKDLAGLIFDDCMQALLEDDQLKQFRFLGKYLSQFISHLIEVGVVNTDILNEGFDYSKWRKAQERQKRVASSIASKEEIVTNLCCFLEGNVEKWCLTADVIELCQSNHKQFLQLKAFLDKYSQKNKNLLIKCKQLNRVLIQCSYLVPISSLSRPIQEELIHWIFRNEDRVWRYRGGRDGRETLQQFMSFIGTVQAESDQSETIDKIYPGVAIFIIPSSISEGFELDKSRDLGVSNLIGYSVGEVVSELALSRDSTNETTALEGGNTDGNITRQQRHSSGNTDCYEIVTSWVNPRYRKLNLSVSMYFHIIRHAPSGLILCDMLVGSVERIIFSNPLLRFIRWIGLQRRIIWRRKESYCVEMQSGGNEQFEQVVFVAWPMRVCLGLYRFSNVIMSYIRKSPFSLEPNQLS